MSPLPSDKTLTPSSPRIPPSATTIVLLAVSFGLCAGYLDLSIMIFKRVCWDKEGYLRSGRDFLWTVPVGHAILLVIPGLVVAAVNRLRPRPISPRLVVWLFATLATSAALLRLPLHIAGNLLLAAGLGRMVSDRVAARGLQPRRVRTTLAGLVGLLAVLATLSSGRQALEEYRAVAGLPGTSPGARNVVLIVWDTVRAYSLSLHGYPRDTTPNLTRWARLGVRYDRALAPAPWTYPSHSSFLTGQWPFKLDTQWNYVLDAPYPTLAEYLGARGYQTAGFAANTRHCSYETGLERGFIHFEDYALTPRSLLSRTVPGSWILKNILNRGDHYDEKWIDLQSRGAREINQAFLDWLGRRRPDRPFFAFLNYYDAHDPYVPPPGYEGRFGIRPRTPRDFRLLFNFDGATTEPVQNRDILMARDCYDDSIAFLDEQLGLLLDELRGRGLLENTEVIITSDHGEAFGDHGILGHSSSVNLDEVGVPLVILSPSAPAGRVVDVAVSLRDLPATVVDRLGLSAGSPFPGGSLAVHWGSAPGRVPPGPTTLAFSEQANASAFLPYRGRRQGHPGFQMSLVASGRHYIREGMGTERLYDLRDDPFEMVNLMGSAQGIQAVQPFRRMLLDLLTEDPGSTVVEDAYMKAFRQDLKSLVEGGPAPHVPLTAVEKPPNESR
jgi:arylsulfatase A-like enzyme